MQEHIMRLQRSPFDKVKNGTKSIELRLFDEKRALINIGDIITFICEPEQTEVVTTKVIGILRYPTFPNLIDDFPLELFGWSEKDKLIQNIYKYYTQKDELKNGVVGIKLELTQANSISCK